MSGHTIISRRQAIRRMGVGAAALFMPSVPDWVLPELTPAQAATAEPTQATIGTRAISPVLLSDDEKYLRVLVGIMLERANIPSIGAQDGYETIKICQTRPISLVISDIHKPGIDGLEMLRILKADRLTADIPFMFFSACGDAETIQKGLELGADDYLVKPILHHDLVKSIKKILARHGVWFTGTEALSAT